jgi:hypothetical protein
MGIGIFSKDNSFSEFPTGRFTTTFRNGSTAERPERWIGVTVEEKPVAHFQFTTKHNGFEFTSDRKNNKFFQNLLFKLKIKIFQIFIFLESQSFGTDV